MLKDLSIIYLLNEIMVILMLKVKIYKKDRENKNYFWQSLKRII